MTRRAPRSLRVTPAGKLFLGLVLAVGLGALNTGNNLLYLVLGLMLSAIVASGILSERTLRGLQIKRVGTDEAFAGEPFSFYWSLTRERGASFALSLREVNGSVEGEAATVAVLAGEEARVEGTLLARRRGPITLRELKVTTLFPLGLFAKSRVFEMEDMLLIFPRRLGSTSQGSEAGDTRGEGGARRARDGGGDLLGLRALEPGEDARRIHWMKSAAQGSPLRAEREDGQRRQVTLTLDDSLPLEALEAEVERTAARARRLLDEGIEVGLRAGRHQLRPGTGSAHAHRLWTALAWVGHA